MIKAIETHYKGYRFRSRLEARWAVFFEAEGIEWEYEKEGFSLPSGPYLPDFWLPQVNMWAEVKGREFTAREIHLCSELAFLSGNPCLLLQGMPDECAYWACEPVSWYEDDEPPYWGDYFINNWYLDERRFFSCTGESGKPPKPIPAKHWLEVAEDSVQAARSARFEHGERP